MVLHLKVRKSRSPPGPHPPSLSHLPRSAADRCNPTDAGWSSPVARQAHNLKVVGSNPTPATTVKPLSLRTDQGLLLFVIVLSRHCRGSDVEARGGRLRDRIDARICGFSPHRNPDLPGDRFGHRDLAWELKQFKFALPGRPCFTSVAGSATESASQQLCPREGQVPSMRRTTSSQVRRVCQDSWRRSTSKDHR